MAGEALHTAYKLNDILKSKTQHILNKSLAVFFMKIRFCVLKSVMRTAYDKISRR